MKTDKITIEFYFDHENAVGMVRGNGLQQVLEVAGFIPTETVADVARALGVNGSDLLDKYLSYRSNSVNPNYPIQEVRYGNTRMSRIAKQRDQIIGRNLSLLAKSKETSDAGVNPGA